MAIPTVQLTGKVLGPDGVAPTSGTITVVLSDPGTVMDGATAQFVSGRSVWTLGADGSLPAAADIVPNDVILLPGATAPGGTYYTAHYDLLTGGKRDRFEEEWEIASSPTSLDIGNVSRVFAAPGVTGSMRSTVYQAARDAAQDTAIAAKLTANGGNGSAVLFAPTGGGAALTGALLAYLASTNLVTTLDGGDPSSTYQPNEILDGGAP